MFTNREILDGIIRNELSVIRYLNSTCKPIVSKWIQKNKGSKDDAEDVFQEAFLIVYRKLSAEGEIKLTCAFSTYFFAVCKHVWFKELRLRSRFRNDPVEGFCDLLADEERDETAERKLRIYLKQLNMLEQKCKELLLLYCKKKSLSEIMIMMGFKNAQAVADKKKNCRKKLVANLLNCREYKELQSEIFIEN